MGGGKGDAPPPIDPGESMGKYLFGRDFESFGGVTDPRLQERLIGAEETYRPRYAALELQDIQTFAQGIGGRDALPGYEAQQSKVSELESQLAGLDEFTREASIGEEKGFIPSRRGKIKLSQAEINKLRDDRRNPEYTRIKEQLDAERDKLQELAPKAGTPGLFDLLEESGRRAGALQRESLAAQRAADVAALREYAPQVVEAYREADPRSAELADLASERAKEDIGLAERGEKLLDTASAAEQKLLETGMAFADLTPTEQEALLQKRGTQFLESTGELSPLEQRRVQQQARAGSMARGRLMDESGVYSEAQARMAEELGKREREIALGSRLLGQEAGMRGSRIGMGGQLLQAGEGLGLRRQGLGASLIGQENAILGQRIGQAFGMQRGIAGDLGAAILGRPSQALALGGNVLSQAQGQAAGPMGPQLFDPNVGINLALQQRGQDIELQGMQAQATGAMIGGLASGLGSMYGAGFFNPMGGGTQQRSV